MAVEVVCVGRLVCDANGEEGDHGGDEVEYGVQRFGQNPEAAGDYGEENFEADKNDCGADGSEGGEALFVSCLFERFGHSEWVRRCYGLTPGDYTLATLEKQRWGERGT
jgi:hypothetical protein